MQIEMGVFRVVEIKLRTVTVHLGKTVHVHLDLPFNPNLKVGDHIRLYTEIEPIRE